MTHAKLKSVVAGTLLGGLLLIGTAGLALAKDPGATPTPSAAAPTAGAGMNGAGMNGAGMNAAGMNAAGMNAAGMMNGAGMGATHASMTDQGHCADQLGNEAAPGSQS